jgi:O-antigen/teichoic acid export membrane protein
VRGSVILSIGQGIAALSGFVLTLGLVKFLDQAAYGQYNYILSLAGIIGAFTLSGMDSAVAQSVARGFDKTLLQGFKIKFYWSIPASLIAVCVGGYYLYQGDSTLGISLLIIGICNPLLYASSLYGWYFNGKGQFKKIAYDNAFRNIAITVSILITAFLTHEVVATICVYTVVSTLISSIRYGLLARTVRNGDTQSESTSLALGKHLSVMDTFSLISTYIDKVIVFQFLGATALAFYALALAPIKQLQGVSKIIRSLILPKFSTRTARELKHSMPHKTLIFSAIALLIAILYGVIAQFVFLRFFPGYGDALLYSQVLSLSLLFMPSVLHVQALTTLGKKRELYIIQIVKSVSKIVLLLMLIPPYGIWGAILAYLGTHVITNVCIAIQFRHIDA